ncbi:MAG: hypothetical protein Q4C72_02915 [Eubacteriales bacterium]|nr:hypothetical protein [Eubacteriales bacterium]
MKEELIRVENGRFRSDGDDYQFDIAICRGECIGVYVDDHLTSGTAYLDIFKGYSHIISGKVFCLGRRSGSIELERYIAQRCMIIDRQRFDSGELTVWDFVLALDKSLGWRQKRSASQRLLSPQSEQMRRQMSCVFPWEQKLIGLSLLDYYRLAIFRAWFWQNDLVALDRLTEILRQKDLEQLMHCVRLLLQQGAAVIVFDMDEEFLYRHAIRIDVIKARKTCYRLHPEEYDGRLYEILGWKRRGVRTDNAEPQPDEQVVLAVSGLTFPAVSPLNFEIRSGEIAFLRDENYNTVSQIRDCFVGEKSWLSGAFCLDGRVYTHAEMRKVVGTRIGIQIERPDRPSGVLFDNLTALDNLCICLLPKAGQHIMHRNLVESILQEASRWFSRDALLRPLREWPLPERLRFSYYKWYFLSPRLLICFFPFVGQESAHHEMIIDMLVTCAQRGMAVWVVSSGIDAICEKTENKEFLKRLHYLGE